MFLSTQTICSFKQFALPISSLCQTIVIKMKFQLVSDLHLEFDPKPNIQPLTDTLFLGGDIGYPNKIEYKEFLFDMASKFKNVYLVAGNHEFYKNEYHLAKEQIQKLCNEKSNLHFLDRSEIVHHDLENDEKFRIVGCTLWSHVPPNSESIVGYMINDYRYIQYNDPVTRIKRMLKVSDTNRFHNEDVKFIESKIATAAKHGEQIIVLAHHAPLAKGCSSPEHDDSPINSAFQTSLDHLMGGPVKLFCFGHTHFNADISIGGTRILANQKGYSEEYINWNPNTVFEIE